MTKDEYKTPLDEFEEDTYEAEKEIPQENSSEKSEPQATKSGDPKQKKAAQGKKQSVIDSIKSKFSKEPKEEIPELWTGQTSVLDVLAPSSVDNSSRDYIVVDGVYHSYLYVAGYGYQTRNEAAWLSPLVEAGDNIGISFTFRRMPRDKTLSRITQKTMLNRSKMREVDDTRQDYEQLDDAISSGFFLKEACCQVKCNTSPK